MTSTGTRPPARILLGDDHALVREGIAAFLKILGSYPVAAK